MRFGTSLPLRAVDDTALLRDTAQALDGAGFDTVSIGGHLLSVEPGRLDDRPEITYVGPFHDPFVLFAYLAAITERIHFRTSVLILPLFPTAVVAKQAAELSILSGGRFELGVGVSWNEAEYRAAGADYRTRGRRLEEQLTLLRRLWTEPFVTFEGRFHSFDRIGLNRTPPPIPIWIGSGTDEHVLRRAARLADGWTPMGDPEPVLPDLRRYVEEAGRDPATFGLTMRVILLDDGPEAWRAQARRAQSLGATELTLAAPPMASPADGLKRLVEAREVLAAELG